LTYEYKSIKEIIDKIERNEIYLPAIQRKFVWDHEQIEKLFDSIMRSYPIGTFLFWFVRNPNIQNYVFYEFLRYYHEQNSYLNKPSSDPIAKEEIIGVLDGQQRLSSMYIALQGMYAYKKPYVRRDHPNAYPERKFFLNLLKEPEMKDGDDFWYDFQFLTEDESKQIDENQLWFPVGKVLLWGKDPEIDEYYDDLLLRSSIIDENKEVIKAKRKLIKQSLRILHQRIVLEKLISYFNVDKEDLEEILDIFVRVNSGGTILTKSDLLFSTIVSYWEDGRREIENLILEINKKGEGFRFDNDFIMRACLVLTDCPVLFKVKSFKKENIEKIRDNWKKAKKSIINTVDLLTEFGFNQDNLTSLNAVIPILYYDMNIMNVRNVKKDVRKYLIHALLNKIYGSQGDRVLSNFRESLISYKSFSFNDLTKIKLPSNKTLKINEHNLDAILEYKKGPYTFMVLSLLYPNLKLDQVVFHQDHIHPRSFFTDAKLNKLGIPKNKWKDWREEADMLPNLQLMEGRENERKNKTPFLDWINGVNNNGTPIISDKKKFIEDNYIPNESYEFDNFENFFSARKTILKEKLREILF